MALLGTTSGKLLGCELPALGTHVPSQLAFRMKAMISFHGPLALFFFVQNIYLRPSLWKALTVIQIAFMYNIFNPSDKISGGVSQS